MDQSKEIFVELQKIMTEKVKIEINLTALQSLGGEGVLDD